MKVKKAKSVTKFKITTRDWKGHYTEKGIVGMILFAIEDEIETESDFFAQIYCDKIPKKKISGQKIYDIFLDLDCGKVAGFLTDGCGSDEIIMED